MIKESKKEGKKEIFSIILYKKKFGYFGCSYIDFILCLKFAFADFDL